MNCPDCGFEIESLPCRSCEDARQRYEKGMLDLVARFDLTRGEPQSIESRQSLEASLNAIQARLNEENFQGTSSYEAANLLESRSWWYVPFTWIGCKGFIVKKGDLYVNWLGSAVDLEDCFWGHDHGMVCDLVDFTFAPDTDRVLAERLVSQFQHTNPDANGVRPSNPVWYWRPRISAALSSQFPSFRRHFVWFAIPDVRHAYEREGLRFTCQLSKGG